MSLETTIKEIKSLKPFAEENTDIGPTETMGGRRGRKANAIERISQLKRDYKNELLSTAFFIVVAGSLRNQFTEVSTSPKFNLFSTDPETFYKDLASRVHPTLYTQGNASPSNLFDVLGRHLEDKMGELDASQYNQLIFKEKYIRSIKNQEDFANLLKEAVNEQIGAEIVGIQAVNSIVDKAIEAGHTSRYTPIVLNTSDDALVMDLLAGFQQRGNRAYLVVAGKPSKELKSFGYKDALAVKEVNEETVTKVLTSINADIKGN